MNDVQVFSNSEFGNIRTVTVNGEPWFVGKDIAEALGYSNASKAVMNHVDDEDKQFLMCDITDSQNGNVLTGQSKTAIINESGLYSLILSSKLPNAKKFKRLIGKKGIRRATIIKDYVNTITTRQDRTPAQVIDLGGGKYRYLTELECWRLMGYSDDDFYAAEATCRVEPGKMNRTLYHQAGNSIPVPIFESMFSAMLNSGIIRKEGIN